MTAGAPSRARRLAVRWQRGLARVTAILPSDWQDRLLVRDLQRQRERARRAWQDDLLKAKEPGARGAATAMFRHFDDEFADTIHFTETRRLQRLAEALFLPFPTHDAKEAWTQARMEWNPAYYTPKALSDLSALIRRERKERWDAREARLKTVAAILTGATGALGAIIGLVAILKR